jgi:hypothetical protein
MERSVPTRRLASLSSGAELRNFNYWHRKQSAPRSVPDLDFRVLPLVEIRAAQIEAQELRMLMRFLWIAKVSTMKINRPVVRSYQIKKQPCHRHWSFLRGKAESGIVGLVREV